LPMAEAGGMQVFLEDITDDMVADDGGPPRSINAIVPVLSGDPPSARGGHTATRIGDAIYIYGGASREQTYCDKVFRLHITSMSWELLEVEGTGPKTRSGHSGVAWQDKGLVIVGGINMALETFFDDVWLLTRAGHDAHDAHWTWSQVAYHGAKPKARNSHTACLIQDGPLAGQMVVMGGSGCEGPMLSMQLGHLRDLPHTITWSNISHPSHALMAPREMHAAACIGCHLIVFGGRVTGQEQVSDEVVTLCASHKTLKVMSVDQTRVRRCGHTMTALDDGCLLVCGGIDMSGPQACTQHLLLRWSSQPLGVPTQEQQAASEGASDAPSDAASEAASRASRACQGESIAFEGSVGELKTALRAQHVPPGLSPAILRVPSSSPLCFSTRPPSFPCALPPLLPRSLPPSYSRMACRTDG